MMHAPQPRIFLFKGEAAKIADRVMTDKMYMRMSAYDLAGKYGFMDYHFIPTRNGGLKLHGFCGPLEPLDLPEEFFFKGDEKAVYTPDLRTEKGRQAREEIDGVKEWSQAELFDHIGFTPDDYTTDQSFMQLVDGLRPLFFLTYQKEYRGHPELQELKPSEYYKMIGE